jgi:HD-like signal output (HDOD) protein
MLAAAMRPAFAPVGLSAIWSHSLSAAPLCSALADCSGLMTPDEALLLGLLHDLGALALQFLPGETLATYHRLIEGGCPTAYVERLLLGADHGEIGARYLAAWDFPPAFVEAVRYHHQPERSASPLASMVFLAEFWSGLDEDIASFGRVEACLERAGVEMDTLIELGGEDAALRALRTVA